MVYAGLRKNEGTTTVMKGKLFSSNGDMELNSDITQTQVNGDKEASALYFTTFENVTSLSAAFFSLRYKQYPMAFPF